MDITVEHAFNGSTCPAADRTEISPVSGNSACLTVHLRRHCHRRSMRLVPTIPPGADPERGREGLSLNPRLTPSSWGRIPKLSPPSLEAFAPVHLPATGRLRRTEARRASRSRRFSPLKILPFCGLAHGSPIV